MRLGNRRPEDLKENVGLFKEYAFAPDTVAASSRSEFLQSCQSSSCELLKMRVSNAWIRYLRMPSFDTFSQVPSLVDVVRNDDGCVLRGQQASLKPNSASSPAVFLTASAILGHSV